MDQGIHMLDLLMYFAQGFDEVKSFCSNLYTGNWEIFLESGYMVIPR
jgi:predicted dehydrogenase